MSNAYTYSNPYLSLWQSAAEQVQRKRPAVQNRRMLIAAPSAARAVPGAVDLHAPVDMLGVPLTAGHPEVPAQMFAPKVQPRLDLAAASNVLSTVEDCAKTAAEFLWAEIKGDQQESDILAGELKDSECDPLWGECLAVYLAFKAGLGDPMYRAKQNPVFSLDAKSRLAIVGDWGTGDDVSTNVLKQIASFSPDALLHVGDVYYSGTQDEEQANFLAICKTALGNNVRLFSLCGNHDMYSGGAGYYWMLDQIGQQASYFCLQNANWQFLAMDTGHNDNDPFTVATNMTSLVKTDDGWAEEDWLLDKINLAPPNCKTVLLSHHPLFSPFGSVGTDDGGKRFGYNKHLRGTFQAVMNKIAWWFWGHEHTQAIYDPYLGLQRGRCVGASAVPVFKDQQSYSTDTSLETYDGGPPPTWNTQAQLADNGNSYNNGFAIMTIDGASANVDYYQVPILKPAIRLPVTDKV